MNSTESNITQENTTSLYVFDNEYSGELRRIDHTEESDHDFDMPENLEMPPMPLEDHDHDDHHRGHTPDHQ
jgi:hypothetical protein